MTKKAKTILSGIVLVAFIVYLAFNSFTNSISFYYEVSEVKEKAVYGELVNVNGSVVPGSIQWDPSNVILTFKLTDNLNTIDVVYNDFVPNSFGDSITVTVTGIFYENNTLAAKRVITKCPSKYEAAITNETSDDH